LLVLSALFPIHFHVGVVGDAGRTILDRDFTAEGGCGRP
jgi:hypothetical protein